MNRAFKILTVVVVVLFAAGLYLGLGKRPEPFPEGSESAARLRPGPLGVASYDETFVDASRPTQAHGDYPGADERALHGTVWRPADTAGAPFPLVVYSHGFSSNRDGGAYLAKHLAGLGHVTVSVDYPLTSMRAPARFVGDVLNQPADVSFLIDSLLEQSGTSGHRLEGLVDAERIGVMGLSLGGLTSTLASFHPTMSDPRIGAALSIAGPTSFATPVFFTHRQVPFLMLAGDIDAMVSYTGNAAPVPGMIPGSQLVSLSRASHTGFSGLAAPLRWLANADSFGCAMIERAIDASAEEGERWRHLLGTEEEGINYEVANDFCVMNPMPPAMNILRQHMIAKVVVGSYFQSQFAPLAADREAAARYLGEVIDRELDGVGYAASPVALAKPAETAESDEPAESAESDGSDGSDESDDAAQDPPAPQPAP